MSQDNLRTLLHDGLPNPPSALMTPPLSAIRRRAHRRRITTSLSTAVAILVVAGVAMQIIQAVRPSASIPPTPGGGASVGPTATGPWTFAVVGADGRDLVVVREGVGADDPCPGTLPDAHMSPPGPVLQHADRVVVPLPALNEPANCIYKMPVRLQEPLGSRAVTSSSDNTALPLLQERILPRPAYPAGVALDTTNINIVGKAPRPGWIVTYAHADGLTITVSASLTGAGAPRPGQPVVGQVAVHGRNMHIHALNSGEDHFVTWIDGGWLIGVNVDPADHGGVSRAELQRIIDGLTWPN